MRLPLTLLSLTLLVGCASWVSGVLDTRYGPADPTRFDQARRAASGVPSYHQHIKPILDGRCVVCHGCHDAPCQLDLGSWKGVARGMSKASVYGELRLDPAPLSRLGQDAQRASQWRDMGFDSVLNERLETPEQQLSASVLWRSLVLKQENPLPKESVLPKQDFDFSLDRANSCPNLNEYEGFAKRHAQAGMPYGLPGLSTAEQDTIRRWLLAGAPDDAPAPLPSSLTAQVDAWERLLNGSGRKDRLVARYLYEHLYLGNLVFAGDAERRVFKLVRSSTPPGRPVQLIASRRPFDDPGVSRPYYRLQHEQRTVLAKTHMPYELSPARLARWQQWFWQTPYAVDRLPGYEPELASNPFKTFAALPVQSRYRFLLDDAGYFISNFIKGPVCRGQTALSVINDRFWVFFVDPDTASSEHTAQLLAREAAVLHMPAAEGSDASLLAWRAMAAADDAVKAVKTEHMARIFGKGERKLDLSFVWDGDGHNANAALTIFRHFDSATVEEGLLGDTPKTAWLMGYPLLERMFYLLVTGFDVYGNTAHQLQTRLSMDFLRMEGEANFLMLLPNAARLPLRDAWYRGSSEEVKGRVLGRQYQFEAEPGIVYPPQVDPQQHLYGLLNQRLAKVLRPEQHQITAALEPDPATRHALQELATLKGTALQWLPEATLLRIDGDSARADGGPGARYYSLLRNTAHLNVSTLFRESAALVPEENTLTVLPGFVGAYPNALLRASPAQLPELLRAVAGLKSEADYRALADRFAIRRSHPDFWVASDALMQAYKRQSPREAAVLDWSRLENR